MKDKILNRSVKRGLPIGASRRKSLLSPSFHLFNVPPNVLFYEIAFYLRRRHHEGGVCDYKEAPRCADKKYHRAETVKERKRERRRGGGERKREIGRPFVRGCECPETTRCSSGLRGWSDVTSRYVRPCYRAPEGWRWCAWG